MESPESHNFRDQAIFVLEIRLLSRRGSERVTCLSLVKFVFEVFPLRVIPC
jgi:hypothetical protein